MTKKTFSYDRIFFRNTDLFSSLESKQYAQLSEIATVEEAEEDTHLYQPGDSRDAFYLLNSGEVMISTQTREGKIWTLRLIKPGQLFGEMALDGQDPRFNLARVRSTARFYRFPRYPFLEILEQNRGLYHRCVQILTSRKEQDQITMKWMLFGSSRERVLHTLNRLFREHGATGGERACPEIAFSHRELAEFSGLSRPETSKILSDLENEGYITLGYKRIKLQNPLPAEAHDRERKPWKGAKRV